jgi:hypothetical protein
VAADRSEQPAGSADRSTESGGVEPPAAGGNGGEGSGQEAAETGASGPSGGSDPDAAAAEADAGTAGESDTVTVDVGGADTPEPSGTGSVTTGPEPDAEVEESDAGDAGSADAGPAGADFGDDDTAEAGRPVGELETEPVDPDAGSGSDSDPGSATGSAPAADADDGEPAGPREPSPEEIAFGTSGATSEPGPDRESGPDDDTGAGSGVTERADWFEEGFDGEPDDEPVDTGGSAEDGEFEPTEAEESQGSSGFEPAGSTAPSDPLADPNEDG